MKRVLGLTLPLLLAGLLSVVWGQVATPTLTPANTQIRNVATASFTDSAGVPRTVISNEVITIVQPLFNFTILRNSADANGNPTAIEADVVFFADVSVAPPGGQVTFEYTVTNTGNIADTINLSVLQGTEPGQASFGNLLNVQIFLDENCNGIIDGTDAPIGSVTLAPGQTACVIVIGTIPPGAQDFEVGNINLVGVSTGDPAVIDNTNWSQAVSQTLARFVINKTVNNLTPAPGEVITYTVTGANVGAQAAFAVNNVAIVDGVPRTGILVSDILPQGLTFGQFNVPPTGTTHGLAVPIYSNNGGASYTTTPLPNPNVIALLIDGAGAFFPQGANFNLTFTMTVPLGTPAGTTFINTALVRYDSDGDGDGADPGETVTSPPVPITIINVAGIAFGPNDFPFGNAPGDSYTFGRYAITRTGDLQIIPTAFSGTTVSFIVTLLNTGNAPDSYNLLPPAGVPAGWACAYFDATGIVPLPNLPVGPVAPGDTLEVVFSCSIPFDFLETDPAVLTSITLTAQSVNNPALSDITLVQVGNVVQGLGVNVSNNVAPFPTPIETPVTVTTPPGVPVSFPIIVTNTGQVPDTYSLLPTLPPGWTAVILPDTNCDGNPDSTTPVTGTPILAPGASACFVVVVTPPANAAPGTVPVPITVTSNTNPAISDTITNAVVITAVQAFSFEPDRVGTATSPGSIIYTHTLVNNGNESATVTVGPFFGTTPGFTYEFSLDGVNFTPTLDGIVLPPNGGTATLFVRVTVADGVAVGTSDVAVIPATATYASGAVVTDTVTNTTTVVGGVLSFVKTARVCADAACTVVRDNLTGVRPGEFIEYTLLAQNVGNGNLTNVRVSDASPQATQPIALSATATGYAFGSRILYSLDGITWNVTPPTTTGLQIGEPFFVGVDTTLDNTITEADIMPPGAVLTVRFLVRVQ